MAAPQTPTWFGFERYLYVIRLGDDLALVVELCRSARHRGACRAVDLSPALALTLLVRAPGECERQAKDRVQRGIVSDLAAHVGQADRLRFVLRGGQSPTLKQR